jgi:hypothetical protein
VFMVAAAELSVRRLRVVLRMVVRKRIFEWKRWEGCLRTRAFVYSRQLAVYSSANVVEDVGKGDVDNGWRFEISRSFLLSRTCSAVPSCASLLILGTYTYSIRFWSSSPTRNLSTPLLPSFICRYVPDLSLGSGLPWLASRFYEKSLFRLLGLIANNGASQCCVVAAV